MVGQVKTINGQKQIIAISGTTTNNNYSTNEIDTGSTWIDGKRIYRKVVSCGALPNGTSKSVAHGISNLEHFVTIAGIAWGSAGSDSIPLPLVSMSGKQYDVGIFCNTTNIVLECGANRSSFVNTYAILEYTKTSS